MKKFRFLLAFIIIVGLLSTSFVFADEAIHCAKNKFPILFNGNEVDIEAYNINEHTYLNLRDVGAVTGTEVDFDYDDYEIIINSLADENPSNSQENMMSKVDSVCKVFVDFNNNSSYTDANIDRIGSGVFINENEILTCKHLVTNTMIGTAIPNVGVKIKIKGKMSSASIQTISYNRDLVLLKTNYKNDDYVEFTNRADDTAITVSNPLGIESQVNFGEYITNIFANAGYMGAFIADNYDKTSNVVAGGSSGGLLMDGSYNAYGIVAMQGLEGTLSINYKNINSFLD